MTYSLWLKADDGATRRLQRKIDQLSRQCGSTAFEPHVTVSSGLDSKPSTDDLLALAARHPKPTLNALKTQHSARHHQALSLQLQRSRALMALRADALHSLGGDGDRGPYNPHISLLYAKRDAARRAQLARRVPAELLRRCTGTHLELVFTAGHERDWEVVDQAELDPPE